MWNSDHSYYLTKKDIMWINEIMLVKAWKSSENIHIITLLVVYYAEYQNKSNNPFKETDRTSLFFKGWKK